MVRTKHRIGRYRVIAPIGAGGFSTVYRALDEDTNREVAIKVLAENHSMVPETRRRFVDEFNLRATVNSPFIAKMYEVGVMEDTNQPFMVLELASRGDLRRRVEEIRRSHQVLNRADLLMLARHLTEALTALHEADIVHRDVSPGNILIRSHPRSGARQGSLEQGNVTLLEPGERFLLADLGHAKDLIRSSGFTAGGGTQGYAAPEQRDDVTVVDHRADIFSATAIIEWAAVDGPYADVLEPFHDIGLAAEPEDRFANMGEWYEAISDALDVDDERPSRGRRRNRSRWPGRSSDELGVGAAGDQTATATSTPPSDTTADRPDGDGDPTEPQPRRGHGRASGRGRRRLTRALMMTAAVALAVLAPFAILLFLDRVDEPTTTTPDEPIRDDAAADPPSAEQESTTSTTEGVLVVEAAEARPRASIDTPLGESTIEGDLVVTGMAQNQEGSVTRVELRIRNQDTGLYWDGEGGFGDESTPVEVAIIEFADEGQTSGRYETTIPAEALSPGPHLIEVWAFGPGDEGPAESTSRTVRVP